MRCAICGGLIFSAGNVPRHRDSGAYDHRAVFASSSVGGTWTRTETARRIRVAARLARRADHLANNTLLEVQERSHPSYVVGFVPSPVLPLRHRDDDLVEFWRISDGLRTMPDQFRCEGYVADLAFSQVGGDWGQILLNVITVWLGDNDYPPTLLTVPGRRLE